jgi:oxaloacetate decarboxylase alpha subunit
MTNSADRAVRFVDTTLRDGQESLWATAMRTGMILPIAARMDEAGFEAIEIMATTNFKKQIRELKENPSERIRLSAQRIKRTPLRVVRNRYMAAFQITPNSISDLWLERMAANGVKEIRLSDPSNTSRYWKDFLNSATRAGLMLLESLLKQSKRRQVLYSDREYASASGEKRQRPNIRACRNRESVNSIRRL